MIKKLVAVFSLSFTFLVYSEISPPEKIALKALYDCNPSLKGVPGWEEAFDDNGPKTPVGSNKATNVKLHDRFEKIPDGLSLELRSIGNVNDGIVKMNLSGKGLTCLPPELDGLLYIQELDFSDNYIKSNTLEMFNTLTTLTSLDLSKNRKGDNGCDGSSGISGEIPSFGSPFFMKKLNLSGNCLSDIVVNKYQDVFRAGALTLEEFDISDNVISGSLTDRLYFLNKATRIDVSCNNFDSVSGNNLVKTKMATANSFIMTRTECPVTGQGNNLPELIKKVSGGNVFYYNARPISSDAPTPTAAVKVNGKCSSSAPEFEDVANNKSNAKCEKGTVYEVTYSATEKAWTWSCKGQSGGTDAEDCMSVAVEGQVSCPTPVKPVLITVEDACSSEVTYDKIMENLGSDDYFTANLCKGNDYSPLPLGKLLTKPLGSDIKEITPYLSPVQTKDGDYKGIVDSYEYYCQNIKTQQTVKCPVITK